MNPDALNYHHLRYFWAVAREGSVTRASRRLHISQPTVSAQVHELEAVLGEKLLERRGRSVGLTEAGRLVYRYADEIFGLGREMVGAVQGRPASRPVHFSVGVASVVPAAMAQRLLAPVLALPEPVLLRCVRHRLDHLLAELAVHRLDLVLTDAPMAPSHQVRAYNHALGESGLVLLGSPALAERYRAGFPGSLGGAPLLLPTAESGLRRALDDWLLGLGLQPRVVGEFEDRALGEAFGEAGAGLVPFPAVAVAELRERRGLVVVGEVGAVRERLYAISLERRLRNPASVAVVRRARAGLFA